MPKLSDSMADAVIVRWLKAPGDAFERGEGLVEVETDKATVVYEAESAGTLDSILAPEGATVAFGQPIATLANGSGELGSDDPQAPAQPAYRDGSAGERPNATPVARRTAVGSRARTSRRPRPSLRKSSNPPPSPGRAIPARSS